ncbi:MAG: restriction endonuclease subunit S [Bacteroidetes bacterium]|uniref:Restriction endonuclease subunit S n=1 Tax=Candidatus Gallipaludibacter merdavium TaxID=2840839 RepID=A0A9D9HR59_9BACT|nr:restriction endonuclease subunit S [Candidatus Gallipaludibacter merdavium]
MPHYENVPFEVPSSWVWCKLEDIVSFGGGKTPSMDNKEYWRDGNHPWVTSKDMKCSHITNSLMKITDKALEVMTIYERGTLLVVTRSGILKHTLPISILQTPATINQDLKAVSPHIQELSEYLYFVIKANENFILKEYHKDGTTVDNIDFDKFKYLPIPLAPITEQRRIIAETKHWFALIDQIEQGRLDLQEAIKHAKNKILDLAIHGKLVPQDPNDEPASELLKRINPKAEITCDNGHYQNLPTGWALCRLENIVDYEQPTDYIVNSTNYDNNYPIPVLTAGKSFIIGYTNDIEGIYSKLPCIIFDDFTTDSKFVDFPFKVKSSAMKLLQVKHMEVEYVAMFMSITRLIGDTHKRYWISEYSKLLIPIPPYAEQKRIVAAVHKVFTQIDTIMESL